MTNYYNSNRNSQSPISIPKKESGITKDKKKNISFSVLVMTFLFALIGFTNLHAQTTYYSKAVATDFTDVNSWGTVTDGTGTSPASISNADNFVIQNASAMTLPSNATVRQLTITTGSLTVAANTLTVSIASANSSVLTINGGTLTVSGGNILINGYLSYTSGGFNQSGGIITIDPNNAGVVATSTTATQYTLNITSATAVNWTGGKIIILDPPADNSATHYSFYGNPTINSDASPNHTLQFGDGVSADAGGNAVGFLISNYIGSNKVNFGNVDVYGPSVTNRKVTQAITDAGNTYGIRGNLTIYTNGEFSITTLTKIAVAGNIVNNGILTTITGLSTELASGTTYSANPNAQTISGSGIFRNLDASPTANFTNLIINNSSASGVTLIGTTNVATQPANSASVSGTLTFTNGRVSTSGGASVVLGTSAPLAGTLTYTAGGFTSGTTFGRWFTAAGTGSAFTAGADVTNATSRYPFVDSANQFRSAWIERTTPAAAAGVLGLTYTNTAGTSTIAATDGATTIDTKANDSWSVASLIGTPLASASFKIQMVAPGIFGGILNAASTRVIKSDNTFVGAHEAGTVTPGGHRITIAPSDLTSGSFTLATNAADTPFVSIANGNWNNPATWNKNLVPTCTDPVTIGNGTTVTVNSTGNQAKNVVVNTTGTLLQASGDLTIGCTLNNNFLTNNGTVTVSGGALNVNGNILSNAGATFNQSGGDINVDGSDGTTANSVVTTKPLVRFTASAPANLNLTGGTLTIVDPHFGIATSDYALSISQGTATNSASVNHTVKFGNGVSTTAGGHTNGFYVYLFPGSFYYALGNVTADVLTGTNRFVKTTSTIGILGNLTIISGEYLLASTHIVAGNVVNNGTLTATSTLAMGTAIASTVNPSTAPQSISGSGVFRNLATASTASLTSLQTSNSSATGISLNVPLSVSGTLTLSSGVITTTNTNLLTLGTATAAGILTGGSATAYVDGPIARTFATANANTTYLVFPVGKSGVYSPISLAPTTTTAAVFRAETFSTNTGTANASITNLSATKRWEAPVLSGTYTNINVRLSDTGLVSTNIPVQAPTAAGEYTTAFGSTATYAAGPPVTTTSNTAVTNANYTGFLSYATSNACSGTPTPGATTATSATICLGGSTTLGITTIPTGLGVTYQWQSSNDNVTYSNIASATNSTYTVTPTVATWYQVIVTCSAGPASATSTPIQITFTNNVTATTPGTVCGQGAVTLGATPSTGATINWYAAATGGTALNTGNTFVTPTITTNTTYYAQATAVGGSATVGPASPTAHGGTIGAQTVAWNVNFTILQSTKLISVDIFPITSGQTGEIIIRSSGGTAISTIPYTTTVSGGATAQTIMLNYDFAPGSYQLYPTLPTSGINRNVSGAVYPYTSTIANITGNGYDATYYMGFYKWTFSSNCDSPRVPVLASVTTAPTLTLSANAATICAGQTTAPITITAGATDYNTYTFSPTSGVSGTAGTGFSFNPTATTTYTLTATQTSGSLCATTSTIVVTVNEIPSTITIAPANSTSCANSIQPITATGGVATVLSFNENANVLPTTFTISNTSGTGTATLDNTYFQSGTGAVRFNTASTGADVQYVLNSNVDLTGYSAAKITFSHIAAMEGYLNSYDYGYVEYSTDGGTTWVVFTPADYVGTAATTVFNTTSARFSTRSYADWISQFTGSTSVPTTGAALWKTETFNIPAAALTSTQFKFRFKYTTDSSTNYYGWLIDNVKIEKQSSTITWSPVTNLYSDALATVPYTGTPTATVYHMATAATAATTYTATATSAANCTTTATTSVTVNAIPTAPTAVAQTFCNSATVANLVTTSGTGIQWYANATGGTPLASTVALTSTNYFATQTVTGCESPRTSVAVTVNVTTAPTAVAQTFCNSATVANLVTTSGTGIQWYANATGGTPLVSTVALTSTNYFATQTVAGCESPRTSVAVTVNVTTAPTAVTQTFCNGATVANLVTTSGTGIQWYANATGGTPLASTVALTSTNYFATQTVAGCESPRTQVAVVINTTPAPTATSPQAINAPATIANIAITGTAVVWYASSSDASSNINPLASTTPLVNNTIYYATQTLNGCPSTATSVLVTVVLRNDSFDKASLNYYPNPVTDVLNISYSNTISNIEVYNLIGQVVKTTQPNQLSTQLDMSGLPTATYLVQVTSEGKTAIIKVVKK